MLVEAVASHMTVFLNNLMIRECPFVLVDEMARGHCAQCEQESLCPRQ